MNSTTEPIFSDTKPTSLSGFIGYFVKRQKWYFLVIQLASLSWVLDNTLWPYALKLLVDKIRLYHPEIGDLWVYLLPVLIFPALLWFLIAVLFRTQGFVAARTIPRFCTDIRLSMFAYVQEHSYSYFANHFSGSVSNKISDMVTSATNVIRLLQTLFIPAFLSLVFASAMFAFLHPMFGLILIGWVCVHLTICFVGGKKCSNLSEDQAHSRSTLTGQVLDSLSNIINVKLFARQGFEQAHIMTYQQDEQTKSMRYLRATETLRVLIDIPAFLLAGVVMIGFEIYAWQQHMISLGDFVFIFNATNNIVMAAWLVGLEMPNFFKEIGTCRQALSLIRATHDVQDVPNPQPLTITGGEIRFEHVRFHYIKGSHVFDDLSITLKAGSKTGLVGFSGNGKSTFAHLILRFFDLNAGRILIDGIDISQVKRNALRSQISMIPQSPSLFHRTLMENIRYGKLDASDDEVIQAAKHAHCHEFITALPDGYQSLVGERGIKLSGGQRQRIAIARAILENAPILILDEATSALDSITEQYIQSALDYLMKNRTTIVIAHRLSTLSQMNRILVFDKGQIIEDDTPEVLMKKPKGHYQRLWQMQADGFLPDSP